MMRAQMITQTELQELLHYAPLTGEFTWIKGLSARAPIGAKCNGEHKNGYPLIRIHNTLYRAHRLAWLYMTGAFPIKYVDHIDGNRANGRFSNLREVTMQENNKNKRIQKNNTSGLQGVYWSNRYSRWVARINLKNKTKHVGQSQDFFEACCLRKSAETLYDYHPNHGR